MSKDCSNNDNTLSVGTLPKPFEPIKEIWQTQMKNKFNLEHSKKMDLDSLPIYQCYNGDQPTGVKCRVRVIKGDGNCLFRSLSYILSGTDENYALIRQEIVNSIKRYEDTDKELFNNQTPQDYLTVSKMENGRTWGTEVEIGLAAFLFEVNIYTLTETERERVWQHSKPSLCDKNGILEEDEQYPSVFLYNKNGNHYEVILHVGNEEPLREGHFSLDHIQMLLHGIAIIVAMSTLLYFVTSVPILHDKSAIIHQVIILVCMFFGIFLYSMIYFEMYKKNIKRKVSETKGNGKDNIPVTAFLFAIFAIFSIVYAILRIADALTIKISCDDITCSMYAITSPFLILYIVLQCLFICINLDGCIYSDLRFHWKFMFISSINAVVWFYATFSHEWHLFYTKSHLVMSLNGTIMNEDNSGVWYEGFDSKLIPCVSECFLLMFSSVISISFFSSKQTKSNENAKVTNKTENASQNESSKLHEKKPTYGSNESNNPSCITSNIQNSNSNSHIEPESCKEMCYKKICREKVFVVTVVTSIIVLSFHLWAEISSANDVVISVKDCFIHLWVLIMSLAAFDMLKLEFSEYQNSSTFTSFDLDEIIILLSYYGIIVKRSLRFFSAIVSLTNGICTEISIFEFISNVFAWAAIYIQTFLVIVYRKMHQNGNIKYDKKNIHFQYLLFFILLFNFIFWFTDTFYPRSLVHDCSVEIDDGEWHTLMHVVMPLSLIYRLHMTLNIIYILKIVNRETKVEQQ